MARARFVKKARKADPRYGIEPGDSYWWWKFRYGGIIKSKTRPKDSQLTQSDWKRSVYQLMEQVDGFNSEASSPEDFKALVEELISEVDQLAESAQESFDNMPEGLQQGDTGQLLEERYTEAEEVSSELQDILSDLENLNDEEENEETKEDFDHEDFIARISYTLEGLPL